MDRLRSFRALALTLSQAFLVKKRKHTARPVPSLEVLEDRLVPSVAFHLQSDWGSGYEAEITIRNDQNTAISNWRLDFDDSHQISSLWNGSIASHTNTHYVVKYADWNSTIAPGATLSLGFIASPGGSAVAPTNLVLSSDSAAGSGSNSGSGGTTSPVVPTTGTSKIVLPQVDGTKQALQVTINQGAQDFDLSMVGNASAAFQVVTNNNTVVRPSIVSGKLRLEGLAAGRASVRIQETNTGETRYLGVRVRTQSGELPGLPDYVSVGSVSEDTPDDLNFWQDFGDAAKNKRMDIRYIYLNGGPVNGWRTWSNQDGGRLVSYLRESEKLGMIPYFVYYNIPDGGESYWTDLQHIQSSTYMEGYFRDLKFALDLIHSEAPDEYVGMLLEPDFLGYLMQNSSLQASQIQAMTKAAYSSGVLNTANDPAFPDTVQGLVRSINYTIGKYAPNVAFGWQVNLWASPGITTSIPSTGLMHKTDTLGIQAGRTAIANEAAAIAQYYVDAGVTSYGADFVSMDKYGLDAGAQAGAATNPAASTWFWNADQWNNYLLFAKALHGKTTLPVVLWQLPVGHINSSLAANPYDASGRFADLNNTSTHYEDSAPDFFLGDRFSASGSRLQYFGTNQGSDGKISVSGSTITWGPHIAEARDAGITTILFGAGVGDSTDGVGSPPTDGYWWISKVQGYYQNGPISLISTTPPAPPQPPSNDSPPSGGGSGSSNPVVPVGSLSYTFKVNSDWGTGFTADVTLKNRQNMAINGWTVEFDLAANIVAIWNAEIVSHVGNHYVVRAASWNTQIGAGADVTFGFQAAVSDANRALINVLLNGTPL